MMISLRVWGGGASLLRDGAETAVGKWVKDQGDIHIPLEFTWKTGSLGMYYFPQSTAPYGIPVATAAQSNEAILPRSSVWMALTSSR